MKRFLTALGIFIVSTVGARAHEELPRFNAPLPSKAVVLRMRYDGFMKWVDKHGMHMSEVSEDQAADYYARLRSDANRTALKAHPTLKAAIAAVKAWTGDYYMAVYTRMGGGTLYLHMADRAGAQIADAEALALASWNHAPRRSIPLSSLHTFLENTHGTAPPVQNNRDLVVAMNREAKALARVKSGLRRLPAGPAEVLAKFVYDTSTLRWGDS